MKNTQEDKKQKAREYSRRYYQAHKKEVQARHRIWKLSEKGKESGKKQRDRWRKSPGGREKIRASETRSRRKIGILPRTKMSNSERKLLLRAEFMAAHGNVCACCGEKDLKFLTIDHVQNDGHKETKGVALLRQMKRAGWPRDRYALLCFNCNCGRARNGGVCPHVEKLDIFQ